MTDEQKIALELMEYFTPAHVAHTTDTCAYYKCDSERADYRRWCAFHCDVRKVCIDILGGGKVLEFTNEVA